jgi:hypothetical protein
VFSRRGILVSSAPAGSAFPRRKIQTVITRRIIIPRRLSRETGLGTNDFLLLPPAEERPSPGGLQGWKLRLITQTLLVAVFLHPLAAFVFRNFCFSSFFQRAHREDFNLPISECRYSASETTKRDRCPTASSESKGNAQLGNKFCAW